VKFDLDLSIAVLERTPDALRALLSGLPEEWTLGNEGADTWSAFDVVGHLIDGEEKDWMERAQIILAQGQNREFEPFDRHRHLRKNGGRTLEELLDRFAALRRENLDSLGNAQVGDEQLTLLGLHPDFGPVTLGHLLATWVVHDLNHLSQISRVMARQYADAVGPWRAYLSILQR
jgi:hypothetical protein